MVDEVNSQGAEPPPLPLPDVHVFAFGRRGYAFAAANLAASIQRWAPDVRIVLHAERKWLEHFHGHHRTYFSEIIPLPLGAYAPLNRLDPGYLKSRLWDHLPPGEHLYLDADCMAVKDIRPLLKRLQADPRDYIAEVISKGGPTDKLEYCPWVSPAKQGAKMQCPPGDDTDIVGSPTIFGLQTSWAFFRKRPEDGAFFARVKHHHDRTWRREELDNKWGDSMPDELIYGFTCSEQGHDPSWPREVMFYGNKMTLGTMDEIRADYYLMTQYGRIGRGGSVRPLYLDMYDKEMTRVYAHFGQRHIFKLDYIASDKYVDAYKRRN